MVPTVGDRRTVEDFAFALFLRAAFLRADVHLGAGDVANAYRSRRASPPVRQRSISRLGRIEGSVGRVDDLAVGNPHIADDSINAVGRVRRRYPVRFSSNRTWVIGSMAPPVINA